jgi:hypothetical protein
VTATGPHDHQGDKAFLAFGMLLNNGAALRVAELDEPWAQGARTRIRPGLFEHITTETNR